MRKAFLVIIISTLIILPLSNVLAYGTDYRYTGKPYDPASDLYDYGARSYQPDVGRFIQQDPAQFNLSNPQKLKEMTGQDLEGILKNPQALNSYSYTVNNPVRYIDPTGKWWKEFFTGKQSLSSLYGEIGEATMYVNPVMSKAIDHPYVTGALTGAVAGFGLVMTGVIAGTAPWSAGAIFTNSITVPVAAQLAQKIGNLSKLEQTSTATAKLNDISKVIGQSVDQILKIGSKSETVFADLRHSGNVNIFIKNPVNSEKLIRVTLDPTLTRVISAGFDRIKQVEQWIVNGDFVKLAK